ncbi:phosphoribosylglycinamide formyltransferase [Moraxella osloensis]|uniref:Phosphoribosylglycinamide formyltransferase n=1 Tax=Faucicola osloensis TaxID=34062 RepID=A0AAD0AF03_FAUOS|nr:phosphoribosylglycinamide formyltransferase [Moraxella osloensis]ATQ83838.1 phosphoribosylglycinamide formyltransferase [Moraxella osloensis]ATW86331.1 phosphoribosylglycinamide formyltransferase [Moraxella osloensis]
MTNPTPLKIAVLVSGSGSNLQVLIDKQLQQLLNIQIVGVISNKADAYALERIRLANEQQANIATAVIERDDNGKKYTRVGFEQQALQELRAWQPDLVVLAGFMRILTPLFIDGVTSSTGLNVPMINLHPSLLPNYKGLDTHTRVLQSGERYHGCSVHLVTSELDAGEVIAQAVTCVNAAESADQLQQRVHAMEYQLLPMVVGLFAERIVSLKNNQLTNRLGLNLPMKLWL